MEFYLFVINNVGKKLSGKCARKHLAHSEKETIGAH